MLEARLRHGLLVLVEGDITKQAADEIVNAGNSPLMGGGTGRFTARAARRFLRNAGSSRGELAGCRRGGRHHDRGQPECGCGHSHRRAGLTRRRSRRARDARLLLQGVPEAREGEQAEDIGLPIDKPGACGYSIEEAARVALGTVVGFLESEEGVDAVTFVLRGRETLKTHSRVLESLLGR